MNPVFGGKFFLPASQVAPLQQVDPFRLPGEGLVQWVRTRPFTPQPIRLYSLDGDYLAFMVNDNDDDVVREWLGQKGVDLAQVTHETNNDEENSRLLKMTSTLDPRILEMMCDGEENTDDMRQCGESAGIYQGVQAYPFLRRKLENFVYGLLDRQLIGNRPAS